MCTYRYYNFLSSPPTPTIYPYAVKQRHTEIPQIWTRSPLRSASFCTGRSCSNHRIYFCLECPSTRKAVTRILWEYEHFPRTRWVCLLLPLYQCFEFVCLDRWFTLRIIHYTCVTGCGIGPHRKRWRTKYKVRVLFTHVQWNFISDRIMYLLYLTLEINYIRVC